MLLQTHNFWIDLVLNPESLQEDLLNDKNEKQIFEVVALLIQNALSLNSSIANINNSEKRRIFESKKLNIIKYLIIKILAYFKYDFSKINENLPPLHQEFFFTELMTFFRNENAPDTWILFSQILYNRWVIYLQRKTTFPLQKKFIPNNNNNNNNIIMDPFFVSSDMHEKLLSSIKSNYSLSVDEIERYLNQLETNEISKIIMPSFECFQVVIEEQFNIRFVFLDKAIVLDKKDFIDDLCFELAVCNIFLEDYNKAKNYLSKIKNPGRYPELYNCGNLISSVSPPKSNYKVKPKLTFEEFVSIMIKDEQFKMLAINNKIQATRVAQLIFKMYTGVSNILLEFFTGNLHNLNVKESKQFIQYLDDDEKEMEQTMVEEGEIYDEEDDDDDYLELKMFKAIEPEMTFSLAPAIQNIKFVIDCSGVSSEYDNVIDTKLSDKELQHKIYITLYKASELRINKYFEQSRKMYLALFEDLQTSHPQIAEMIHYELLQTDIEIHFNSSQKNQFFQRCENVLRNINSQNCIFLQELIELICAFFLNNSMGYILDQYAKINVEIIFFSSCLNSTANFTQNSKEFIELCLGYFALPGTKYTLPKLKFTNSMENFVSKFGSNKTAITIILKCLLKIYSVVNEFNISQLNDISISSIPANLIDSLLLKNTIEQIHELHSRTDDDDLIYYGEYLQSEKLYQEAIKFYLRLVFWQTNGTYDMEYFKQNAYLLKQMINCASKMNLFGLATVFHQYCNQPDYTRLLTDLSQLNFIDIYNFSKYIFNLTIIEYMINLSYRKGYKECFEYLKEIMTIDIKDELDESISIRTTNLFTDLILYFP